MRKNVGIVLVLSVALMSLATVEALAESASVPKPTVPEFTVKIVDYSYDVPTTYSTDKYTGETIVHHGYHVENKSTELTIKNQPFTPYKDENGILVKLYYHIRFKGHFEQNWTEFSASPSYPAQSDSEYTVISYTAGIIPPDGQVDYQVEAMIGYFTEVSNPYSVPFGVYRWSFAGETSGWSDTQTLTVSLIGPETAIIIASLGAVMATVGIAGLLTHTKRRKHKLLQNSPV